MEGPLSDSFSLRYLILLFKISDRSLSPRSSGANSTGTFWKREVLVRDILIRDYTRQPSREDVHSEKMSAKFPSRLLDTLGK